MAEGEWIVIWMDRWLDCGRDYQCVLENWILLVRNGLSNNIWAYTLNKNDSSIFWLPLRLGVALWQQLGSDQWQVSRCDKEQLHNVLRGRGHSCPSPFFPPANSKLDHIDDQIICTTGKSNIWQSAKLERCCVAFGVYVKDNKHLTQSFPCYLDSFANYCRNDLSYYNWFLHILNHTKMFQQAILSLEKYLGT